MWFLEKDDYKSLCLELRNFAKILLYDCDHRMQNNIKLIPILHNDSNFGIKFANKLVKELEGDIELITNTATPRIVIRFPVGIEC